MKPLNKISFSTYFLLSIIASYGLVTNSFAQVGVSDSAFTKMVRESFRAEGIAGLDRIEQDATQKLCSDTKFLMTKAGAKQATEIQKQNMATIQQPSDGNYIGDWKSG